MTYTRIRPDHTLVNNHLRVKLIERLERRLMKIINDLKLKYQRETQVPIVFYINVQNVKQ